MIRTRLILLLLCALLYACSSTPPEVIQSLEQAESVIDEHPDSALSILDEIEPSTLRHNSKEQAIYALLLTQAREKCHIIQTDDSLISLACEYFSRSKEYSHKFKALFYKGIICMYNNDYASAMSFFIEANESVRSSNDFFWNGMINRGIADLYGQIGNHIAACEYYEYSYEYFKKSNRESYRDYALYDVARSRFNAGMYDEALSASDSLYNIATKKNDTTLLNLIWNLRGQTYMKQKDYQSSLNAFQTALQWSDTITDKENIISYGVSALRINDLETAKKCDSTLTSLYNEPTWLTYELKRYEGKFEEASTLFNNELEKQNKQLGILRHQNASVVMTHYLNQKKENAEKSAKNTLVIAIMSIIAVLLFVVLIQSMLRNRILKQRSTISTLKLKIENSIIESQTLQNNLEALQYDLHEKTDEIKKSQQTIHEIEANLAQQNDDIIKLKTILEETQKNEVSLTTDIKELLIARTETLNKLLESFYSCNGSPKEQKIIYENVLNIIYALSSKKIKKSLENELNQRMNNLITRLREHIPSLNEEHIELYVLSCFGFSIQSISVIQKIPKTLVYSRKAYIRKKIKAIAYERKSDLYDAIQ